MAALVAERLGYRIVDDDLPIVVAARLGTTTDVVDSVENRLPAFGERVLQRLAAALPEISQPLVQTAGDDFQIEYRREIERLVHEAAHAGNVIIMGRVANAILGRRPDVLRVFVHAPLAWRSAQVRASLDVDEATARSEIARIDEARRAYAQEQYRMAWGETRQYDLTLDTSRFGVEGAAEVIAAAIAAAEPTS